MKIRPQMLEQAKKQKKGAGVKEAPKAVQVMALVIAFISVYYFLIKLLFL